MLSSFFQKKSNIRASVTEDTYFMVALAREYLSGNSGCDSLQVITMLGGLAVTCSSSEHLPGIALRQRATVAKDLHASQSVDSMPYPQPPDILAAYWHLRVVWIQACDA